MTWYLNFCAPYIPNDPTIITHRYFQGSILTLYTIFYAVLHTYYLYWGPLPLQQENQEPFGKESAKENKQNHSDSESNSEENNKDGVSIKLQQQANQSCIELKKTSGSTWAQTIDSSSDKSHPLIQNVTIAQIQHYYPIVYGHFAIAMALSIMYTPYAEQSISCLLYILLTIPLLIANSKRMVKTTRIMWTCMTLILVFMFTCGLLEVGQSNWDVINLDCFSNLYQSIYQ